MRLPHPTTAPPTLPNRSRTTCWQCTRVCFGLGHGRTFGNVLEVSGGASREAHENPSKMVGSSVSPPPAGSGGVVLRAPSRFSRGRASPTDLNDGDDRE